MTLAQNAQSWLDLLVVAARELEILGDTPERQANIVRIKRQVVDALLAEWSAGEGLDFEGMYETPCRVNGEPRVIRRIIGNGLEEGVREALNTQHRARLAAERQKWEAREAELEVKLGRARCYLENLGEFILAEDIS